MINVIDKHCLTPLCYTIVTKKYKGYCYFCFVHMFPNEIVSRNYKTKEKYVVNYILNVFKDE